MQQQPSPEHPFTITMEFRNWDMVLGALNEAPHRIARPLIDHIMTSINAQAQASQPQPEVGDQPKPNGSGEHLPA